MTKSPKFHEKPNSSPPGFTLIEVLVSLGVLAIIAGLGTAIFLSVNQTYAKASINNKLRKEGSRVMEEISRISRSGTNLAGAGSALTITLDRDSLEYEQNGRCETEVIQLETPGATDNFNSRITKSLANCEEAASGAGVITDDNRITGANVASLSFTVTDGGSLRPDQVTIALTLEQGLDAPHRQEYKTSVDLRNTISTREY